MTRVTGKFQITLPKRLAETYGIQVGDQVELVAAGDVISIMPASAIRPGLPVDERLRLFDKATQRLQESASRKALPRAADRGWTREELYDRGRAR